jgi:hypothetical protein
VAVPIQALVTERPVALPPETRERAVHILISLSLHSPVPEHPTCPKCGLPMRWMRTVNPIQAGKATMPSVTYRCDDCDNTHELLM